MRINQRNNKKKVITVSLIVSLLLISSYAWYSYSYKIWPFEPNDTKNVDLNNSDSTNNQKKDKANNSVDGVDITKNTSEVPISDITSIEITDLSQSGQLISYSATIVNPSSTGICSATFTKENSMPVKKDVVIKNEKCGPFSVSANTFDSLGEWTLTLRYFADNTQAVTTSMIDVK